MVTPLDFHSFLSNVTYEPLYRYLAWDETQGKVVGSKISNVREKNVFPNCKCGENWRWHGGNLRGEGSSESSLWTFGVLNFFCQSYFCFIVGAMRENINTNGKVSLGSKGIWIPTQQKPTDKALNNPKWFPHTNQVPYVIWYEEKQLYPNDKQ